MANLSGADWWRENQASYPNSRDVDDLAPAFRSRVEDFIGALRKAGAKVTVNSTLRNATRAHLMHYSWRVAYDSFDAAEVPRRSGLDIEWDHGDEELSRAGAEEMVKLFNMAHIASLTSNHIRGTAIDMDITWKDTLVINKGSVTKIESSPRTGAKNRELHDAGADLFEVYKLRSDPPHWSHNGK